MKNLIKKVDVGSIAEEVGIEVNDVLISINGTPIDDIIDYKFLAVDEEVVLEVEKPDGEIWEYEIEKEYGENLGLEFQGGIMDKAKRCSNNCMFCFIDWYQRNCIPAPGRSAGIPRVLDRDKNRRDGHEA